MRYALRNQDKIAAAYSQDYLERHILQSLNRTFKNYPTKALEDKIDEERTINGKGYRILRINDVADENSMLEFAVTGRKFDVLHIAFLGRMKG